MASTESVAGSVSSGWGQNVTSNVGGVGWDIWVVDNGGSVEWSSDSGSGVSSSWGKVARAGHVTGSEWVATVTGCVGSGWGEVSGVTWSVRSGVEAHLKICFYNLSDGPLFIVVLEKLGK